MKTEFDVLLEAVKRLPDTDQPEAFELTDVQRRAWLNVLAFAVRLEVVRDVDALKIMELLDCEATTAGEVLAAAIYVKQVCERLSAFARLSYRGCQN